MEAIDSVSAFFQEKTRGTQIAIYSIAGAGLALALHKVRPVSKFSRAADVPKHFIQQKEPLKGKVVGFKSDADRITLLLDHRPFVRIPLWHSGKDPLPVQIWGVKPAGGLAASWLQSVAINCDATAIPVKRQDGLLYAQVKLQWPRLMPKPTDDAPKKKLKKRDLMETIDVGERVVQVGMAQITPDISKMSNDNISSYLPFIRDEAAPSALKRAQNRAMHNRDGHWHEVIPPSRFDRVYTIFKPFLLPKSRPKAVAVA